MHDREPIERAVPSGRALPAGRRGLRWRPCPSASTTSRIEGVGRQRVETSFIAADIDRMVRVPDAAAVAAVRLLEQLMRSGRLP
ncbi:MULTISPECIES: hypothetical protein [unclassified Janibacter]|uniref:hypothetical protein n=1 Tax=unclassified Janibacter TaxID=2649294 RepID=UPI003F93BC3D